MDCYHFGRYGLRSAPQGTGVRCHIISLLAFGVFLLVAAQVSYGADAEINPVWQKAYDSMEADLHEALDAYGQKDVAKAKRLILKTQFDDYKNSLLETAVRRNVSQSKDYDNNNAFLEMIAMINDGATQEELKDRIDLLLKSVKMDLPGLPLVEGAVSERAAEKMADEKLAGKDWKTVGNELVIMIDESILLYGRNEAEAAVQHLQNAYFDVYEKSEMEGVLGARDEAVGETLANHFSALVKMMSANVSLAELNAAWKSMKPDFEKANSILGRSAISHNTQAYLPYAVLGVIVLIALWIVKSRSRRKSGTARE